MNSLLRISYRFAIDQNNLIGKGSTGNVYLGFYLSNYHQQYAVKAIDLNKIDNPVTNYLLACYIYALNELSKRNNPHIVQTYYIVYHGQYCYLVMELLEGGSLAEYIRDNSTGISYKYALSLFKQMIYAYGVIKYEGIIHRDIKPDNLIFRKGYNSNYQQRIYHNYLCFIDFGYCLKYGVPNQPQGYYNVGSPKYMSPYAFNYSKYSYKSDIWAMGVIFYEMLHGRTIDLGLNMEQYFELMRKGDIKNWKGITQYSWELMLGMLMYKAYRRLGYYDIYRKLHGNNSINLNEPQYLYSRIEQVHMERKTLIWNRDESSMNLPLKISPVRAFYEGAKCKSMVVPDWENQTMWFMDQGKQEIKSSLIFPSNHVQNVRQLKKYPSVYQSCMMLPPIRYRNQSPQSQQQSHSRFTINVAPSKQYQHNNQYHLRDSISSFYPSFIKPITNVQHGRNVFPQYVVNEGQMIGNGIISNQNNTNNNNNVNINGNKFIRREVIFKSDLPVHQPANKVTTVVNHQPQPHHQPQHKQITSFVYPNPPQQLNPPIIQQHNTIPHSSPNIRTNTKTNTSYFIKKINPYVTYNFNSNKTTNIIISNNNNNINHSQNTIKHTTFISNLNQQIPTNIRPSNNALTVNVEENDCVINAPSTSNQTKRMSWYFDSSHVNDIKRDNVGVLNHHIHHQNNPLNHYPPTSNNNIPLVPISNPNSIGNMFNNNTNYIANTKMMTVPVGGMKRMVRFSSNKSPYKQYYQLRNLNNTTNNNIATHIQHLPPRDNTQLISYYQPPQTTFTHHQHNYQSQHQNQHQNQHQHEYKHQHEYQHQHQHQQSPFRYNN